MPGGQGEDSSLKVDAEEISVSVLGTEFSVQRTRTSNFFFYNRPETAATS